MALVRELIICSVLLASAALATNQRRVGAPAVVSENDEGVQRALQFAMNEYNKASNDKYSSRVSEVITAQKQDSESVLPWSLPPASQSYILLFGLPFWGTIQLKAVLCKLLVKELELCGFHSLSLPPINIGLAR
ncbi:hypothetical protein lerEdw1_015015 [Lerista edwardsae]|nr:hypothetical protein lerEdw1_015015 [Lerista edwardsae]